MIKVNIIEAPITCSSVLSVCSYEYNDTLLHKPLIRFNNRSTTTLRDRIPIVRHAKGSANSSNYRLFY